jgi:hypothetical protein
MKKEINRTLGNSLRCILPSFWWKRLLGMMVDKIDSAEDAAASAMNVAMLAGVEASNKQDELVSGSNIKTINGMSILGSGNIVVDTDTAKVEKYKTKEELDAVGSTDGGEIAAVVDAVLVEKSFTECYQPTRAEISTSKYNTKFTKVDGLALNPDFNPNLISSNYGRLIVVLYSDGKSKGYHKGYPSHLEIECDYSRRIICWEYDGTSGSGHTLYDSSVFYASTIDRVNNILREGNFRFSYFEVTYKKNADDAGYTYYYSYNDNFPSDATAMIDNVVKMLFAETQNADIYVRASEWVRLLKEGDVTGGAGAIIDSEISDTSENPVQNKVVKAYVDEKVANSGGGSSVDVDTELSNTSTNPVQNKVITNAINAKADNTRIDLISERLDDIDSEMKDFATESQLNNKQDVITDLDNIRQGAAKGATALQSIPSEYVTENELSAKNYATTSQVNAKQDVISDIETIRSGADKGATSIQKVIVNGTEFEPTAGIVDLGEFSTEDVDTSSFATKDELIDNEETHATALVDLNSRKVDNESFEQNSILTNQHISSILNNVEELEDDVLINENIHAAALTDLNSRKANIKYVDDSIVTIDKQIQVVEQDIIDGEYVHTAALNDINSRKPDKEYIDVAIFNVNKYASSISASLTTLSNDVVIDESVHAAAFNDINTRKSDKTYVDSSVTEVNERVADVIDNVTDGELTHASAFIDINDRKADKEYVDNAIIDTNKNISNVSNEFGILESGVIDSENIYASAIIDLENRKVEKSYVDNELATFLSEFIRFKNEGVPVIDVTDDVIIIEPNKYYKWTNAMSSITVTLHTPTTSGTLNNYMFEFKVSASGCTLTVPAGVKWANGEPPELKVNKTYQVSIINNLAVTSMFG